MTFKSRKTDHFQICIDLRTVVHHLQCFPKKHRTLIAAQPFLMHVDKQAAKRASDQPFHRYPLQFDMIVMCFTSCNFGHLSFVFNNAYFP